MNKTGHIIVETGFINNLPSTETLCYTMQEDFNSFFGFIADVSDEYGDIVIHDYLQYYYDMYCTSPEFFAGAGADAGTC